MAMGDSVTARGSTPESTYRYWLYTYLTNAGFYANFVGSTAGSQNEGASDGVPANLWPEPRYEGGSSPGPDAWNTTTGVQDAPSAATEFDYSLPSFVLLDLGANDANDAADGMPLKATLLQVQTNLEAIINTFNQQNSSTIILLAVPTPWVVNPPNPVVSRFIADVGGAVRNAARDQRKAGVDVIVVGLHSGFNPRVGADTKDGTHPNIKGEQLIARRYFNALRPVLKKMRKQGLL